MIFSYECSTQLIRYLSNCKRLGKECHLKALFLASSIWNIVTSHNNMKKFFNKHLINRSLTSKYTSMMEEWVQSTLTQWVGVFLSVLSELWVFCLTTDTRKIWSYTNLHLTMTCWLHCGHCICMSSENVTEIYCWHILGVKLVLS